MAKFDLDVTKQKLDALMLEADTSSNLWNMQLLNLMLLFVPCLVMLAVFWNPIKMHEMGSIIIHPAFLPCKETTAGLTKE